MGVSDRTFIEHCAENLHLDPEGSRETGRALSRTHRHKEAEPGLGTAIRSVDRALGTSNALSETNFTTGCALLRSV
jgi:hypothetical protein